MKRPNVEEMVFYDNLRISRELFSRVVLELGRAIRENESSEARVSVLVRTEHLGCVGFAEYFEGSIYLAIKNLPLYQIRLDELPERLYDLMTTSLALWLGHVEGTTMLHVGAEA